MQYAAIFGRERNQTGVLIELIEEVKAMQQSREGRADLVDQIWYALYSVSDSKH